MRFVQTEVSETEKKYRYTKGYFPLSFIENGSHPGRLHCKFSQAKPRKLFDVHRYVKVLRSQKGRCYTRIKG